MAFEYSHLDITFSITGLSEAIDVRRVYGSEEISELYQFDVDFVSAAKPIEFANVIGQTACITCSGTGKPRYLHGIVTCLKRRSMGERGIYYEATLRPKAYKLTLGRDCRIFQEKTMKEIVSQLLDETALDYQFNPYANEVPAKRIYCVQYRESDWTFISRLLALEGYVYYFEHKQDKHILHFTNHTTLHQMIPGDAEIPFYPPESDHIPTEHIRQLTLSAQICPDKVTLTDYDFLHPSVDLKSEEKEPHSADDIEIYDYPGLYHESKLGKKLAKIRLEQVRSHNFIGEGQAACTRMTSGHRFTLTRFEPLSLSNKNYLITHITHDAERPQTREGSSRQSFSYNNFFRCAPEEAPFRPTLLSNPKIQGVQTATVVGSEEILVDKYGRIKVQFHWDREGQKDEKSSCWIRVAQIWAGPDRGNCYIPRKGDEVIVEFEEGDPDRPIIIGSVHNAHNMPPVDLPSGKSASTMKSCSTPGGGGDNEFKLGDSGSGEEVFLHGQKDYNIVIGNDVNLQVGNNQTDSVAVDKTQTVGANRNEDVGGNVTISIGGSQSETIGGSDTQNVGGSQAQTVGGSQTETVGGSETKSVGGAQSVTVATMRSLTVGAAYNEAIGAAKSVEVGGAYTENVGAVKVVNVGGTISETSGGGYSIKAGGNFSADAGGNAKLAAGGSVAVTAGGDVGVTGKNINIEAKSSITLKQGGAQITLKGGNVTIKASKITIKASGDVIVKGSAIKEN